MESRQDLGGWGKEWEAAGIMGRLTCMLAWEPGLPDGQAESKQQFIAWSGQPGKQVPRVRQGSPEPAGPWKKALLSHGHN